MKTEDRIQQDIVKWFNNNYCLKHHNPRQMIFHVANQTINEKERMRKLQIGMLPGVSDLIVLINGKTYFIEIKDDNGKQQPKQIEFQNRVEALGFEYVVIRSLRQFQKKVKEWL